MCENIGRRKRRLKRVGMLGLAYVAIYAVNSAFGQYEIAATGQSRMISGFAFPDQEVWCTPLAKGHTTQTIRGRSIWTPKNLGGVVFAPLLWLDQQTIHRSRSLF